MTKFSGVPIVAPSDLSKHSMESVSAAIELAGDPSRVTVLHVITPFVLGESMTLPQVFGDDYRQLQAEKDLRDQFASPSFKGLNFKVRVGDPGSEIVNLAADLKAGLIVMPSHGRTGLAHLLIGSVAERVVRLAACPVLVLRT